MKAFSIIAFASLISAVFSQQQPNNATAPFNKDEDNYPFKTEITNGKLYSRLTHLHMMPDTPVYSHFEWIHNRV